MSKSDRQRQILEALGERPAPLTVDQLVDELIRADPTAPSPSDEWAELHERLVRCDLPELDDTGRLRYDRETGLVEAQSSWASVTGFSVRERRRVSSYLFLLAGFVAVLAVLEPTTSTASVTSTIYLIDGFALLITLGSCLCILGVASHHTIRE
ncbi:DUF7344 domain-containing protein (plasmid) [Haloferacaceae archaeon DSL9]